MSHLDDESAMKNQKMGLTHGGDKFGTTGPVSVLKSDSGKNNVDPKQLYQPKGGLTFKTDRSVIP